MEISRCDNCNDNLTKVVNIQQQMDEVLKRMDAFLAKLEKDMPNIIEPLVITLKDRLRGEISDSNNWIAVSKLDSNYKVLQDYPELVELATIVAQSFMGLAKYENKVNNVEIEISFNDYVRSADILDYHLISTFASILPRQKALAYYEDFIAWSCNQVVRGRIIETLTEYVEFLASVTSETHAWTYFKLNDGVIGKKMFKCLYYEAIKDFNDLEIASLAEGCVSDFYWTSITNGNFVLTRTQTLFSGDYCDFCWHDTRLDKEMKHPEKEFWEKL